MKAIECNKAYLGTKEVTQGSISVGDSSIGLLYYTSIFRKLGDYQTGDAVVWDTQKELFKVTPPENINQLDTERYIPTGVIAIPSSHDVYGTGECGVMALMSASLTTPDTGQATLEYMHWGAYVTDYPELNNFKECSSIGRDGTWTPVQLTSGGYDASLPSDQDSFDEKILNPNGEQSSWYYGSNGYQAPSPYNNDGSRNPDYYDTNIGTNNALSDFAGKSNTEFLCSKATKQENWKTDATITNNQDAGYHPAACACWRFHTVGTSQGDWYLPACGELGYVCVRYKLISETIAALQAWSGKTYCSLANKWGPESHWSSSERDSYSTRTVDFYRGTVGRISRYNNVAVRPFTRLK